MDFSKLNNKIFFENKFINSKDAKIHVLNHSLHFATSVFEGIRIYNKKPLFIYDHIKRLFVSSKIMGLNMNYSQKKVYDTMKKLIKINNLVDGYIRPIIYRSSHSMSPETYDCKTLVAIACWKWGTLFSNDGISMNISQYPRLKNNIYPIEAKSSGSYQTSVISRIDSKKKNFDDCLMLDLNKNVAESSACNIFWVKKNTLYTPKDHSILNGVTRQAVIRLCKRNKIKLKVGDFKLKQLLNSDSVFLTGTAAEIQPVKRILNKKFNLNCETVNFLKRKYEEIKKKCPESLSSI